MATTYSKDNPPADNDFTPEAVKYRELLKTPAPSDENAEEKPPQPPEDKGTSTEHEEHGGAPILSKQQAEEKPGADPAPRHYDVE